MAANQSVSELTADILKALAAKLSPEQVPQASNRQRSRRPNVNNQANRPKQQGQPQQYNKQQRTNTYKIPPGTKPNQILSQQHQQAGVVKPKPVINKLTPKEIGLGKIRRDEKVVILMRGCPGSGKTTLARQMQHRGVIFSADDYFIRNGQYEFEPSKLNEAHACVQKWCLRAMEGGRTPIIIDNTNLESWEMVPYVNMALKHCYFILLLEPETPWRYNAAQLTSKNTHQIGFTRIVRMLDVFDRSITAASLMKSCKVSTNHAPDIKPSRATPPTAQPKFSNDQINKNRIQNATAQQPKPNRQRSQFNRSDSGSAANYTPTPEHDGWSSNDEEWASQSSNLHKSKSVPDMMQNMGALSLHRSSPFVPVRSSPQETQQQKVSSHMQDLLELDFNFQTPPPEPPASPAQTSSKVRSSRGMLGIASPKSMLANWEIPAYPGVKSSQEDDSEDDAEEVDPKIELEATNESRLSLSEGETVDDPIKVLKSFFASVPDDALNDIYERCKGDLQWVVNLLLDAGYEMKVPASDNEAMPNSQSRSDEAQNGNVGNAIAKDQPLDLIDLSTHQPRDDNVSSNVVIPAISVTDEDRQPQPSTVSNEFQFRLDAGFAKLLQDTFGPVGFNLSSDSYSGSELDVTIPFELAAAIHECWSNDLCNKFKQEDTELIQMMTDEAYAQLVQEEEFALSSGYYPGLSSAEFPTLDSKESAQKHVHNAEQWSTMYNEDLALKIKRKQLYEKFPQIDRKAIDEMLESNNARYSETANTLNLVYEPDMLPQHVIAPEFSQEYEKYILKRLEDQQGEMAEGLENNVEEISFVHLRDKAQYLLGLRKECFEKAKSAFQSGLKDVASVYSQQGHQYTNAIHAANKQASEMILEITNSGRHPNTLDLHLLTKREALNALTDFLSRKQKEINASNNGRYSSVVYIITGRGNHSADGVAKIRTAVDVYLKSKNYSCYQVNAGCIEVILRKLTG